MLEPRSFFIGPLAGVLFVGCAQVAAPIPPEAPPTQRHQAESLAEEGMPPEAITVAPSVEPASEEPPWLPSPELADPGPAQSPRPALATSSAPWGELLDGCVYELDPSLEVALVAEPLPESPPTRLDAPDPCVDE